MFGGEGALWFWDNKKNFEIEVLFFFEDFDGGGEFIHEEGLFVGEGVVGDGATQLSLAEALHYRFYFINYPKL